MAQKIKAHDNPWYLLATLYDVPGFLDHELQVKNRAAWTIRCKSRRGHKKKAYRRKAAFCGGAEAFLTRGIGKGCSSIRRTLQGVSKKTLASRERRRNRSQKYRI